MINLENSNRRIRVIDPSSTPRLKCPECNQPGLHIYKLDSSLYFCGNCASTFPIRETKHELIVVPTEAEKETFIVQSKRKKQVKNKGLIQESLEKKGLMVTDYIEIKPQPD